MKIARIISVTTMLVSFGIFQVGCDEAQAKPKKQTKTQPIEIKKAVAVLYPTVDNNVEGELQFIEAGEKGIRISGTIRNLSPGNHGFHIHEYGDCSAEDATSAGGHFNPFDKPHGAPGDQERHVGDLGNITADSSGMAQIDMTDSLISFEGEASIIGRAVVVHLGEDDLESQPTGAAGARQACGVIGITGNK
jgi:Cu-Zn family superoxide dismutase